MKKLLSAVLFIGCMMAITPIYGQSKKEVQNLLDNFNRYEVSTVKVAVDGTKFVKVWGYGKKVDIAIENAKMNAVHASLFRGIPGMESAMPTPAICREPNAFEANRDYFVDFFLLSREYVKYVNVTSDGIPSGQDRREVKGGYKVALYVQVMYDNLKDRMELDGIVRKLNTGF